MLGGEHLSRPAHARLHFVDNEYDSVFGGKASQAVEESGGWNDVTALPLNWFDDNRRNLVGRDQVNEQLVADV
jgi:hypothetical protein